jgi:O-antigen ligase
VATHRIGFAAIAERPFFGFGSKGYERVSFRFEEMIYGNALHRFHSPASENLSAHSSFLQVLVDRGVLGFAAFVGLLLAVVVPALGRLSRMPDGDTRRTLLALTVGVVAFIVQAATENLFDYSKVAAVFWIIAAAVTHAAAERPPETSRVRG